MSVFAEAIRNVREQGRAPVIPFIMAGDPDIETSYRVLQALADGGAAAIEIGVPFSDPVADGPTIQRAAQRSLARGTRLAAVLDLAREFRRGSNVPVVLFSYLNPLLSYGLDRLCADLPRCGIEGVLVTDLPHEEAGSIRSSLGAQRVDLISLVAPTTSEERLRDIAIQAGGFIYAISRSGVTGAERSPEEARRLVERLRRWTQLPVAVGFGISTPQQAAEVCSYADAAVVGSALVSTIERHASSADRLDQVRNFIASLQSMEARHVSRNA